MVITNSVSPVRGSVSLEKTTFKVQSENNKKTYERQLDAMYTVKEVVGELKSAVEELQKPTVSADTVKTFVNAYNDFLKTYEAVTKHVPVRSGSSPSPDTGALIGNSMLRMLQSDLNKSLHKLQGTQDVNSLNKLGISLELKNNKTRLVVDDSKLRQVLSENPDQVTSFLTGDGTNTGFATTMNKLLDTGTKNITAATDSLNELIRRNS